MNENMISVATRMYNPDQLYDMSLFDVLSAIQKGNLYGNDLIGITQKIQSLTDKDQRDKLKYYFEKPSPSTIGTIARATIHK